MNNWGKDGEVIIDGTEVPKEAVEGEEAEKATDAETPEAGGEQAPKEPELKGLDEYYESIKDKRVKIDAPKKREAGEGVDQSAWAAYVPLAKEKSSDEPIKHKKKEVVAKKDANATGETLETAFHFPPPAGVEERGRGRGDRRGGDRRGGKGDRRGGDRRQGGGRQGGDRRGSENKADFKLDTDFPALSSSGGAAPPPAAAKPAAAPTSAAPASSAPVKA